MRIVIAPDSFKGSLSAWEAAQAIQRGVKSVAPESETILLPLADGGEGLVETLIAAQGGQILEYEVEGPLGSPVSAKLGLMAHGQTAVIEMAQASGLTLIPPQKRNPLLTSSFGTGQLIKAALDLGAGRLLIGLGGSATNDGGLGLAQALGFIFLDQEGNPLKKGGAELNRLARLDASQADPRLQEVSVWGAYDVANPLFGPQGAAFVYGPQKGATAEQVRLLDQGLANLARVLRRDLKVEVGHLTGAGAAGGMGAGLAAFLGAELVSGIELVLDILDFRKKAQGAQLVFTGEGKFDGQSAYGKVSAGVGALCQQLKIPVVVLAGAVAADAQTLHAKGITAYFSIVNEPMALEHSLENASALLTIQAAEVLRLFLAGSGRF